MLCIPIVLYITLSIAATVDTRRVVTIIIQFRKSLFHKQSLVGDPRCDDQWLTLWLYHKRKKVSIYEYLHRYPMVGNEGLERSLET